MLDTKAAIELNCNTAILQEFHWGTSETNIWLITNLKLKGKDSVIVKFGILKYLTTKSVKIWPKNR